MVYEVFDKGDYEPLLTVKEGHSALIGKSVSFIKRVGLGYVVMLGTLPEDIELQRIVKKAAELANAERYDTDNGIMITKRVGDGDTLYIAASVGGKSGEFRFDGEYTDILSGEVYKNVLSLKPFELHLLRKN